MELSEEFAGAQFGDQRLYERCIQVAQRVGSDPTLSFPRIAEDWGWLKGAYRFFSNPRVTREKILEPHVEHTVRRCMKAPVVLAVQDTTTITYSHHLHTEGLGPVDSTPGGGLGMIVHTVLAVDGANRQPFGVLHQEVIIRHGRFPKTETYQQRLGRKRESQKWINGLWGVKRVLPAHPKILHICDREADIYLFIKEILAANEGFVIRGGRNHSTEFSSVINELSTAAVRGAVQIHVPRNGTRPGRNATVEIQSCSVRMQAPKVVGHRGEQVPVNVVRVKEPNPPPGQAALHWILLTSEPVDTLEECLTSIRYYQARWLIEDFHKGLKSGCNIEERQLSERQALENALGLFTVIAAHLLYLRSLSAVPLGQPIECGFSNIQIKILQAKFPKEKVTMEPNTIIRLIARMGGFIGRKSDGNPGWLTIMRGISDLLLIEQGVFLAPAVVGKG
jgi:hypothetical protein